MSDDPGVLLALDFGLKRIGVASGNRLTGTASPVRTLHVGRDVPWQALDALVAEWQPVHLVVGMPASGRDQPIGRRIEAFARALEERYALAVHLVDESLTSAAAASAIRSGRRSGLYGRRLTKGRLDRHAACLIAEQWMNGSGNESG